MENKEEKIAITLTKEEFCYLLNDLISYIWKLEEKGLDKDNECGYFSRRRLKDKLRLLQEAYFSESTMQG